MIAIPLRDAAPAIAALALALAMPRAATAAPSGAPLPTTAAAIARDPRLPCVAALLARILADAGARGPQHLHLGPVERGEGEGGVAVVRVYWAQPDALLLIGWPATCDAGAAAAPDGTMADTAMADAPRIEGMLYDGMLYEGMLYDSMLDDGMLHDSRRDDGMPANRMPTDRMPGEYAAIGDARGERTSGVEAAAHAAPSDARPVAGLRMDGMPVNAIDLGWYRTKARIDLATDVVPTPADIGGSTYRVDRAWVEAVVAACRRGYRLVIVPRRSR